MKKILLTGFVPFADYLYNPTEEIVIGLNNKIFGDREIVSLILPCTYLSAFDIASLYIDNEKPYAVINLGLASSVYGVSFETRFRNIMNGKYPDNDGFNPNGIPIVAQGNQYCFTNCKHDYLSKVLQEQYIPSRVSVDAEGFICNSLGYLVAKKNQDEQLHMQHVFIHIPWTDNYKGMVKLSPEKRFMSKEAVDRALKLIIMNI